MNELSYEVEVLNETVQKIRDDIGKYWTPFLNCFPKFTKKPKKSINENEN